MSFENLNVIFHIVSESKNLFQNDKTPHIYLKKEVKKSCGDNVLLYFFNNAAIFLPSKSNIQVIRFAANFEIRKILYNKVRKVYTSLRETESLITNE